MPPLGGHPEHERELAPHEVELRGNRDEHGVGDAVERRIRWLVTHRLETVASRDGGWEWLFRDPRDGRLWELTFPSGSIHGSGPRRLTVIAEQLARARYAGGTA